MFNKEFTFSIKCDAPLGLDVKKTTTFTLKHEVHSSGSVVCAREAAFLRA